MSAQPGTANRAPQPDPQPGSPHHHQAPALSSQWRGVLARSSVVRAASSPWAGLAACLMYHRICPDQTEHDQVSKGFAPNRDLSVALSAFDEQMAYVAQRFNCLSLPEAVEQLARGKLPPRSLIVTFDDGYLDNLTLALPILRKYAVPATVYIATGLINQDSLPWWYELEDLIASTQGFSFQWRGEALQVPTTDTESKRQAFDKLNPMLKLMDPVEQARFMGLLREGSITHTQQQAQFMNRRQLMELAADPLITIGAHTHHHLALSTLNDIRLRHEMIRSRELLEAWLSRSVEHLAYPYGGHRHASTREFQAADELGFSSAVTTRLGHFQAFHRKHRLALPRIGIGYQDCMARFEWKLSGLYSMVRRPLSRLTC